MAEAIRTRPNPPTRGSLVAHLSDLVKTRAGHPAALYGADVWTYGRIWDTAAGLATYLLSRPSNGPVGRIGLVGANHPLYLAGYLGILRAGGIAVPLNHFLLPAELAKLARFADLGCCLLGSVSIEQEEAIRGVCDTKALNTIAPRSGMPAVRVPLASESMILLTSGSTGDPKGVVHSHRSLMQAVQEMQAEHPFSPDEVAVAFLPFFASLQEHALPVLLSGGTLDVLPRFDPEAVARSCARATSFDAVPTIMARLLDHGDFDALSHLRWVMFASEVMPPSVLEWWWSAIPSVKTYQFYGMTELLTISHANHQLLKADPSTVGVPFRTAAVEVLDDSGNSAPPLVDGEIVCRSPAGMSGYFRDATATMAAFTPLGSIRTGDLGHIDEAGRIHLTGRLKDIIISGGLNVSPAEIEAVAAAHPDVAFAAVVGIPDLRWGETPVVVVVPKQDRTVSARDLLSFCRRRLSGFKRPSGVAVVPEIPTTGIGKAAKRELRIAILAGHLNVERAD
jgi:acyl-CoA synthetase (AMP-forming)/AMP-acid ligase II